MEVPKGAAEGVDKPKASTSRLGKLVEQIACELGEEDLRHFASLYTDLDRLDFLLQRNSIQDILRVVPDFQHKDVVQSQRLRTEGNQYFAKKKFIDALTCFNKGILLAPLYPATAADQGVRLVEGHVASEELLLVMANRSAALQFLKFYQLSIRDIDLAIEWGYPSKQLYKLWDRKGKCLSHLGRTPEAIACFNKGLESLKAGKLDEKGLDVWRNNFSKLIEQTAGLSAEEVSRRQSAARNKRMEIPEITGEKSAKFESTNNSWALTMTERMGRQIVAKDEVLIGDVLAVEKPMAAILYESAFGTYCYNCMLQVKAPIPCHCCSAVAFCSVDCQQQAWHSYHYVECAYLTWMSDKCTTKLGHLALRVTLTTPYNTLRQYFRRDNYNYARPDLRSGLNEDGVYQANYKSLISQVTSGHLRLPDELLPFSIMAILMLKVLRENAEYCAQVQQVGDTQDVSDLILATSIMHHIQVVQCNALAVSVMNMATDFRQCQPLDIGLAIYPTMSLINHSCDPNVEVTFYGSTSVPIAVADVKAGEPLHISYGMCYYTNTKEERDMSYQTQFYFNCQCEPCRNDWPLWDDIECRQPIFKCGKCGGDLPTTQPGVIDCPHCHQRQDITEVLYRLQMSHDLYSMAMKDTLKGQVDAALPILEEHLRLMQTNIKGPWRDMVSCMGTLKQIYNIKAFFYSIGYLN